MDMHALRAQFQGRIASLKITTHHKAKVDEEQRAEEERDAKLAPYDEIKAQLQALLVTLEEKRMALEKVASGK